ncbi:glycosyltransferase 61 family protein [Algoriphagus algorifonticola]|uniref:glycosyltransferase 61 family protein n=1 Tax=Algoriphagus algorifonticola TaxID=2593007 RepID=UPI0011A238FF|nr:glycosyltransferase 61 family protein [Algoriphagus algorifonticola]
MKEIKIIADPTKGGDLGNYWHYMLGFFLPILVWLEKNSDNLKGKKLIIDSCNPMTDKILEEFLKESVFPYEIKQLSEKKLELSKKYWKSYKEKLKRRLLKLEIKLRGTKASLFIFHEFLEKKDSIIIPRWDVYLELIGSFPKAYESQIMSIRNSLIDWADSQKKETSGAYTLILKRSDPPTSTLGKNSIEKRWLKGYGSERRQLKGIDSLFIELEKRNENPLIFASGDHNLKKQICVHHRSKTLIAIRGADLFNMFWMPSNSTIIMQASSGLINKAAQPFLARCCGHQFYEIPHNGEKSPTLNFETIRSILNGTRNTKTYNHY